MQNSHQLFCCFFLPIPCVFDGLHNRENMPSHFKVKEYCPLVFRNLRERFGVDDVDYRESLTRSQPVQIDSSGKSGAQFYRSYDKYFILKSLTSEEIERMHAFLKHYHPVSTFFFIYIHNSFVLVLSRRLVLLLCVCNQMA